MKTKKRKKRASDKSLTNKLDALFRTLMWLKKPRTNCFVCHREAGRFKPKTNPYGLQVGHFIGRTVFPLRWDFRNCDMVCSSCNRIHEENILPHTHAMLMAHGSERVDLLNSIWATSKQKAKSFSRAEKLEMIEKFKEEIKELE